MEKKDKHQKAQHTPNKPAKKRFAQWIKPVFWFFVGVLFASFCLISIVLVYFRLTFKDKIIPGVFVGNEYIGEKTVSEVEDLFKQKNEQIGNTKLTFKTGTQSATITAKDAGIGYDANLIALQASSIGNSKDVISNAYHIINSYLNGIYLRPSFTNNTEKINQLLKPISESVHKDPVDALFTIENNRVLAFKKSEEGKTIDTPLLEKKIQNVVPKITSGTSPENIIIEIPVKILLPEITTEEANDLGIVEPIGTGTSQFAHSIPNRVHNVALAASRVNGVLVPPGETFSLVKTLGDISKLTGYKEAYVIESGKTVLGDGGGVCQVSTTLFRAVLNAGLPVLERNPHAYRVGYYEQDSPPGIDAAVYVPSVDFKFKNDTGKHIFVQETIDLTNLTLTFTIYGTDDGRTVSLTTPVVTGQSPAPETQYQDDPTLPKGVEKQIDFAAAGANVVFSRTVTSKDGKKTVDTFRSNYRPWRAVFLRGTKEG